MLNQIYNMTAGRQEDYINPTIDGPVSWRSFHSFDSDSEEAMYNQQERNNEISSRRCASVKTIRWIGSELRDPPMSYVTGNVEYFLDAMSYRVVEDQRIPALDMVLKATPTHWWAAHKKDLTTWDVVQPAMMHQFVPPPEFECQDLSVAKGKTIKFVEQYEGKFDPYIHIENYLQKWEREGLQPHYWLHKFLHTLGPIPKYWYSHEEYRRQTRDWTIVQKQFCATFVYVGKTIEVTVALLNIKQLLFTDQLQNRFSLMGFLQHRTLVDAKEYARQ